MTEVIKHTPLLWERKDNETQSHWLFWCPGCGCGHTFRTGYPSPNWTFNGLIDHPSFTPSFLQFIPEGENRPRQTTCHLYLTDGKIQYLGDSPHKLSGQTVPMEPIHEEYGF